MRPSRFSTVALGLVFLLGACQYHDSIGIGGLNPPQNLTYEVEPSGTPGEPAGITLHWTAGSDASGWNVYSSETASGSFSFRATTTSNSFHDEGRPALQYYVTATDLNGLESDGSNVVTVDERLALPKPASLQSVSLNGAIALFWADDAALSNPAAFRVYRVYSTAYDIDANTCGTSWSLEGTTVAPEFQVGALVNGVPQCFDVSAISVEGFESVWSPSVGDTPRPDSRNVALTARPVADATSGFRFWRDLNGDLKAQTGELGRIGSGSAPDIDFSVERDASGAMFLTPVRAGTTAQVYGTHAIGDLTDIDFAPLGGYARTRMEALPGWGYVFQMDGGDTFPRYGGLRVTHVGRDLVIFDWSFQTDPGNPELSRGR
ncbi:MAG: hypothetical protein ABI647_03265 [Gemmatimonadota bacterium]